MAKNKKDSDVATVVGEVKESERLSLLKSRLTVAKTWCKKPHKAMKKWIAEYEIDDISDTEEIRDKVRIGYVFRKTESELPAIFDDQPELFLKGRNEKLKELESLFEGAYDYLWDIQSLEEKVEDVGLYFELLGLGFMESPWVTKTKTVFEPVLDDLGQPTLNEDGEPVVEEFETPIVDNPVAKVLDPFKIYFSPETKFNTILDYEHCPYYFIEHTMTVEEVKSRFGKDVEAGERLKVDEIAADEKIASEYETNKDDLKRVTVWEYYGVLPEEKSNSLGNDWSYDKDYHIWFTKNEELQAEQSAYAIKPCLVLGNYGLANKFWKFGDAKHLMPLVQELEMYRSQVLKHTRKMANPKPLVELNSEVDENAFSDSRVGKTVKYSGIKPEYLSPASLGREVSAGIEMVRTDLEKTAPGFDLAGGGGQSQVRSPRGIQVFAEASDRGVRRKRKKVARFIRHLIIFQFGQLAANWTPEDAKVIEVEGKEEPMTAEVLQVLGDDNILKKLDIEIESLSVNRVQMKSETLELFDIASKHPDLFNLTEIAKDMLQNGFGKRDADRYMTGEDQRAMQVLMNFVQILNQTNPELALVVRQMLEDPQLPQMLISNPQGESAQITAPKPQVNDSGIGQLPSI